MSMNDDSARENAPTEHSPDFARALDCVSAGLGLNPDFVRKEAERGKRRLWLTAT